MQEKSRKIENSKTESHHQSFIEHQNLCPLCASELVIEVLVGEYEFHLKEQATCPQCDLVARLKDHSLH